MDFPKVYFQDRQSSLPSGLLISWVLYTSHPENNKNPKTREIFDYTIVAATLI